MDREPVRQTSSAHGEASSGPTDSSPLSTPTPPRLTPNPMLLDTHPTPAPTPTTSSPPPPLTPAPSVSTAHVTKVTAPSPHVLVPAPPKLVPPALRTYSRPILPSPKTHASSLLPASTTSSAAMATNTCAGQTNGITRPVSAPTSTAITPFHTPASPPGRQVTQTLPAGSPGLVRTNQSPAPVRPRLSQQTLLLGKGLKGSGQDQVLLRAQMLILTSAMRPAPSSSSSSSSSSSNPASAQLQSLTPRPPPPPGTLTVPPTLRLKPPSLAPPPRPQAPLFPPLRPRPQPSTTATERPTAPSRHLSVPPPTLYSPVRAVPLRPRLHSPNGHRAASPRQPSILQPIAAAAPSGQTSRICRSPAGLKNRPLPQPLLGQSQHGSLPVASPSSHFERSPSAARQLQIIALSSGRQPQPGVYSQAPARALSTVSAPPELSSQSKRTLSGEDTPPLPLEPSSPKTSSPLPSPPSLLSPASPPSQAGPQPRTLVQRGDGEEERERGRGAGQGIRNPSIVGKDLRVETDDQREKAKMEKHQKEAGPDGEDEQMEVTEEGQGGGARGQVEEESGNAMDQSEKLSPDQPPNPDPIPTPEPKPNPAPNSASGPLQTSALVPPPLPEVSVQTQEDFCENMSTQSDNQSALSSLSSQSPPSSPFITPSAENPPPLLSAQTAHPILPDLSMHDPEKVDDAPGDSPPLAEAELLGQSDDEPASLSQLSTSPWEPRAWPEGRQVLTHLVEGFVIQEGLQPFPVNRSSLLVPEPEAGPQEVNGTNDSAASPVTDAIKPAEPSTDSGEEDGGDTDDPGTRSGHRDRTVLHCQFCGKRGHAHNFMRSKRFCSTSCARGFNVRLTKRLRALSAGGRADRPRLRRAQSVPGKPLLLRLSRDLWSAGQFEREGQERAVEEEEEEEEGMEGGGEEEDEDDGGGEEPAVAMTARMERRAARRARRASAPAMTTPTSRPAPSQWTVEEVTAFIHALPGCGDVAEAFRLQEIDGQALLLLTEDHLMTSMNIKLGPALKICAHINALKNQ